MELAGPQITQLAPSQALPASREAQEGAQPVWGGSKQRRARRGGCAPSRAAWRCCGRGSDASTFGAAVRPTQPPAARHPPPPHQAAEASGLSHDAAVLAEFKAMISAAGLALSPELAVAGDLDATLRRFLRARKGRLDAAFAMLQSERI